MNICIINTLYPPNIVGGAEKSVSLLAQALVAKGHVVSVISLHSQPIETIEDRNGVKAHYLPLDNIHWPFQSGHRPSALMRLWWHVKDIWNAKAAARVGRILDQEKPDVVHTNNLTGFSVAVWHEAKKRRIRIVHTLRDYSLVCARSTLFNKGRFCNGRCVPCVTLCGAKSLATRDVDCVIGNSNFTLQEHLRRGYFKQSANNVIFNIADVKPVAVKMIQKNAEGNIVFGFLGRVEDEKGIHVLLQACEGLPKKGWQLLVAGNGREDYVAALKKKYHDLPIDWLGFIDAEVLFSRISVLVVPSLWPEPLPRTIIEAAARGIPVLASDAGGQPELLNLGLNGIEYPAQDIAALAGHMRDIVETKSPLCDPHASHQTTDWNEKLSAETVVSRYIQIYRREL